MLEEISISKNGFLDYDCNGFTEYLETERIKSVLKKKEYKNLQKRLTEIEEKYPRVREFIEDKDIIKNPTKEEQQAIFEIIEIAEEMAILDEKESFKLGMKEILNILN